MAVDANANGIPMGCAMSAVRKAEGPLDGLGDRLTVHDGSPVVVCPVDYFQPTVDEEPRTLQLYLHPEACIGCTACMPPCPLKAIMATMDGCSR